MKYKLDQEPPEGSDHQASVATLYSALLSFYLYADNMMWSRTQLLVAVQVAVMAAGFFQRTTWIGPVLMAMGAVLTFLIFVITLRDDEVRNRVGDRIVALSNHFFRNSKVGDALRAASLEPSLAPKVMSGRPARWRKWVWGRNIIRGVMITFILLDVILALLYYLRPGLIPSA